MMDPLTEKPGTHVPYTTKSILTLLEKWGEESFNLANCSLHCLGPLISVVYNSITGCQRFVLFRAPFCNRFLKEILIWDIPSSESLPVNDSTEAMKPFRISSTWICYIGDTNFVSCFLLLFITTGGHLYAYKRVMKHTDSWSDVQGTTQQIKKGCFTCLESECKQTNQSSSELFSGNSDSQPQLLISVAYLDVKQSHNLAQHLLVCSTQTVGYITCSFFSLDIKLYCEINHVYYKKLGLSALCATFDQLGHIRVLKLARAPTKSNDDSIECLILISGSKRCGILVVCILASHLIKTRLYCIGTQQMSSNLLTSVEAVYPHVNISIDFSDTPTYLLCARPKNRLWVSNMFGRVLSTLKIHNVHSLNLHLLGHFDATHILARKENFNVTASHLELYLVSLTNLDVVQKLLIHARKPGLFIHVIAEFWDILTKQLVFLTLQSVEQVDFSSHPEFFLVLYHITFLRYNDYLMLTHTAYENLQYPLTNVKENYCLMILSTSTDAVLQCQSCNVSLPIPFEDDKNLNQSHSVKQHMIPHISPRQLGCYFWRHPRHYPNLLWLKVDHLNKVSPLCYWTFTPLFNFFKEIPPKSLIFLDSVSCSHDSFHVQSLESDRSLQPLNLQDLPSQLNQLEVLILHLLSKKCTSFFLKRIENKTVCSLRFFCLDIVFMDKTATMRLEPHYLSHATLFPSSENHEANQSAQPSYSHWSYEIHDTQSIGFNVLQVYPGFNTKNTFMLPKELRLGIPQYVEMFNFHFPITISFFAASSQCLEDHDNEIQNKKVRDASTLPFFDAQTSNNNNNNTNKSGPPVQVEIIPALCLKSFTRSNVQDLSDDCMSHSRIHELIEKAYHVESLDIFSEITKFPSWEKHFLQYLLKKNRKSSQCRFQWILLVIDQLCKTQSFPDWTHVDLPKKLFRSKASYSHKNRYATPFFLPFCPSCTNSINKPCCCSAVLHYGKPGFHIRTYWSPLRQRRKVHYLRNYLLLHYHRRVVRKFKYSLSILSLISCIISKKSYSMCFFYFHTAHFRKNQITITPSAELLSDIFFKFRMVCPEFLIRFASKSQKGTEILHALATLAQQPFKPACFPFSSSHSVFTTPRSLRLWIRLLICLSIFLSFTPLLKLHVNHLFLVAYIGAVARLGRRKSLSQTRSTNSFDSRCLPKFFEFQTLKIILRCCFCPSFFQYSYIPLC